MFHCNENKNSADYKAVVQNQKKYDRLSYTLAYTRSS